MMKPFHPRGETLCVILALWYLSGGCGRGAEEYGPQLDIGDFEPYVAAFEQAAKGAGEEIIVKNLRIRFGNMDSPYEHGICEIVPGETPTITLREAAWRLLSEEERQALLFHELGHCVLRRKHRNAKTPQGLPVSIMYPYLIDRITYLDNEVQYMNELFSGRGEF